MSEKEDFTKEELEAFKKEYEQRQISSTELNKKQKVLEKLIKTDQFPLKEINWHTEMKDVDFTVLTDFALWENKEYEIIYLPTDRVAHFYISKADKEFPNNKLFGVRQDVKIIKLVEHLQSGKKVIPPVIRFVGGKYPIMFDQGNHRFALARFLKLEAMPFIMEKSDIDKIKALFL